MGAATSGLLNQVSTDVEDPPTYVKTKMAQVSRPLDAPLQNKLHPEVKPLELPVAASRAYEEAAKLARAEFTTVVEESEAKMTIECSDTTKIMRYVDDIVIRVTDLGDDKCRVDMRSASRVGKSDLGKNAERVTAFLGSLKTKLT